jgi:hypothetical protein
VLLSVEPVLRDPSRRIHQQGEVEFVAVVGTDGRLRNPVPKTGLEERHEALIKRALAAWRLEPARQGDRPVAARVLLRTALMIEYGPRGPSLTQKCSSIVPVRQSILRSSSVVPDPCLDLRASCRPLRRRPCLYFRESALNRRPATLSTDPSGRGPAPRLSRASWSVRGISTRL